MLAKQHRLQIQNWLRQSADKCRLNAEGRRKINVRKSEFFILRTSANNLDYSQFGVIISAKVSKSAVKRNKIKRIIYDFIRLNKLYEKGGKDVVITVLPATAKLNKNEIEKEIKRLTEI